MRLAKTVDEMIIGLPRNEQLIVKCLRGLISECLPLAKEKPYYALGVPYYSRHRQICYIFPSSALNATEDTNNVTQMVTLGFCQGNLISVENGLLKRKGASK